MICGAGKAQENGFEYEAECADETEKRREE
jgi:hypothetical protein